MIDPATDSLMQAQQGALHSQISVALQKKQLDALKQQGAALVELLEAAAALSKAVGKGDQFDAIA